MPGKVMFETERLLLREFTEDDASVFFELNRDPRVNRYTSDKPLADVEHARQVLRDFPIADYAKHGFGRLACFLKEGGDFIGFAGLKKLTDLDGEVDVGYRLGVPYWGRGLATEALRPAIEFGWKQLGLKRIIGLVDPENVASVRVLAKLGLTYTGMIEYRSWKAARYVIEA